jgi:hypothetical protein
VERVPVEIRQPRGLPSCDVNKAPHAEEGRFLCRAS